jgi:DNA-binding CsgD family transcriptional regulator
MYLSQREHTHLRRALDLLAQDLGQQDVRARLGAVLIDLMGADHFASYVWNEPVQRFEQPVFLNMDPANLANYETWFQYHDPITFALQHRRHATLVAEVMPQAELERTQFFNDFLARDGLHWGINLHAFDEHGHALGDLRIWRSRHRGEFTANDKRLLDLIEPAFIGALKRARRDDSPRLSEREREVARLVAQGFTDKEIARALGVSPTTVRTYVERLFDKLGIRRRSAIARFAR